jgi:diacylglycerol O-acyltransferase / wax synthase
MQRMTGIDPMFIYSDTPETPMEIAYACLFDPSSLPGGYSFERVAAVLQTRIPTLLPFRRRLMPVPLGLDHPRWVDDPHFDLANHLHRVALPTPGGDDEFRAKVAEVMSRPLTPEQPPWEMHVVEGLADGTVGLIAKVHHSVIDGVAGAEMLAKLLDLTPEGSAVTEPCPPWMPARLPSRAQLMTDALPTFLRSPIRQLRAAREVGRTAVRLARCAVDDRLGPVSIPLGAPDTFESPVGAGRAVSFAELSMTEARALKERFGMTINDVVLGVCSGALRTHLAAHGEDVESPLVAVVPVSLREDSDGAPVGNQLSAMFVPLANDKKTPLERLRTVSAASASCKGQERAVGYGPLGTRVTEALPPAFAKTMIQFGVRSGVLRKLRAGNLMVSNVPGPDFPLYFAGMELRAVYPLGPVIDGVALNVTVQSYREWLFVGINACASAVPDLPGLTRAMVDELSLLSRMAAGAGEPRRPTRARPPAGHRPAATPGAIRRVGAPTPI